LDAHGGGAVVGVVVYRDDVFEERVAEDAERLVLRAGDGRGRDGEEVGGAGLVLTISQLSAI
jgi:hypothetical protein